MLKAEQVRADMLVDSVSELNDYVDNSEQRNTFIVMYFIDFGKLLIAKNMHIYIFKYYLCVCLSSDSLSGYKAQKQCHTFAAWSLTSDLL